MKSLRSIVLVVLVSCVAGVAQADAPVPPEVEAKNLFKDGTKFYNLGEYTPAIEQFKAAYKLSPKPLILYNIAQAYRLSGDAKNAVFFYKSYLNAAPEAANRAEIEGRITDLEAQLAAEAAARKPVPVPEPSPSPSPEASPPAHIPSPDKVAETVPVSSDPQPAPGERKPIYKKWWFWTGVGAVAVGAVVVVALASGGGASAPDTDLGNQPVFP